MSPIMESSDFTIRRKDFPALPGNVSTLDSSSSETSWSDGEESSDETATRYTQSDTPRDDTSNSREIIISTDGRVSNIPSSMINDQFGMVGLLTFIRAAKAKPSLGSLTIGQDLTSFGLDLESSGNLYSTFEGPWVGATDYDASNAPYKLTPGVRQRLANVFISKYEDDLLFYLFYSSSREVLQLVAAAELYKRGWRYHKKQRLWMCSVPGGAKVEESSRFSLNTFYVFDVISWKKVVKECFLDCSQIEGQPIVPEFSHIS